MSLSKWIKIFIVCLTGFIVVFMHKPLIIKSSSVINDYDQQADQRQLDEMAVWSNFIFDTSEVQLNNQTYAAVLKQGGIYFVNDGGFVKKHINYPDTINTILQSKILPNAINDAGNLDERTLDFEIQQIDDIDQFGSSDLLLTIRSRQVKEFNYLIAISYETSKVIWQYQPKMKSTKICSYKTFCEEPVEIMEMKIQEDAVYIASGYHLSMLNLKSGKRIKAFQYENNIWSFDFISDINHDGIDDLAIAVQPSKVLSIDGDTFKEINQLNVAEDLILSDFLTLKLNVTKLAYLPSKEVLVAASEDGNIYELDMNRGLIVDQISIFSKEDLASYFPDLRRDRERDEYEYYRDETIDYFVLGDNTPITFDIITFPSIDSDDREDYLVEWNWKINNNGQFNSVSISNEHQLSHFRIEQSSLSPLKFEKAKFRFIYNDLMFFTDSHSLYVYDFSKNRIVLDGYPIQSSSSMLTPCFKGMLMKDPSQRVQYFNLDVFPNFTLKWRFNQPDAPISNKQIFKETDYFLSFERLQDTESYLSVTERITLYNKNLEPINDYQTDANTSIIYKQLLADHYYLIEKKEDDQVLRKVFNAKTGELIETQKAQLADNQSFEFDYDEATFYYQRMEATEYRDLNEDGVAEIVLIKHDLYDDRFFINSYYIYDFVNNKIIDEYYEYNDEFIRIDGHSKFYSVEDDVNQDGSPDLLIYNFTTYNTLEIKVMYSKTSSDLLNKENVLLKSFDIPKGVYRIVTEVDLNNDGFKEIILNASGLDEYKQAAFILDYKQNELVKLTDYKNESYHIEDLNNDGIKEIVTVHYNGRTSEIITYEYRNGIIEAKPSIKIEGILLDTPSNIYSFFDYNEDGVKEIMLSSFDQEYTISVDVFDYETSERIKNHTYNLLTGKTSVRMGDINYYSRTSIGTLNGPNNPYLMIHLPSNTRVDFSKYETLFDQSELLLVNPTSFKLNHYISDYKTLTDSNHILRVNDDLYMNHLIDYGDAEKIITGLFNNSYQFALDTNIEVEKVQVYIHDKLYNSKSILEFEGDEFELNLTNGEYNIFVYIHTKEGHIYQYTDQFIVKSQQSQSFVYQGIILIILTSLFVFSSIKIKAYLHN